MQELTEAGGLVPILTAGGVAVAAIVAMAYFTQILVKSITELVKTMNKSQQ